MPGGWRPTPNFNPRSPCGERQRCLYSRHLGIRISIHALLAESDGPCGIYLSSKRNFNPRSPCGERPGWPHRTVRARGISIHALLAESDPYSFEKCCFRIYFNPRSPCGERRLTVGLGKRGANFNPRSPCGERLGPVAGVFKYLVISIHALLAESDLPSETTEERSANFNPRSPCGERQHGRRLSPG